MTSILPSPTQTEVMTALRGFLISLFPQGTAQFAGAIAGTVLTVGHISGGSIDLGTTILGASVAPGTTVTALGTGTGGTGTYTVSPAQTVAGRPMATGVPVVQGQVNRVPEPRQFDFVVIWPMLKRRLSTNIVSPGDVVFTGSIDGSTLTVSGVDLGAIAVNQTVFGAGVAANTRIIAKDSSSGGVGTYTVVPAQTVGPTMMASGEELLMQPTQYTAQIDVHGPNSADNAQTISTLFRSGWGVDRFAELNEAVRPLHADDPRQIPFLDGEEQVETRWVIDAVMQINATVRVPTQFADEGEVTPIEVETSYPA